MNVLCILGHVDTLLGGDREIGDCIAAVARQRPANNNREIVFSALSAKQQLDTATEEWCFLRGPLSDNEIQQQRNGVFSAFCDEML
jgi:hypothetical protein